MIDWLFHNIFFCVLSFLVLCFLMYLGGRLVGAGWYRSKTERLKLLKTLEEN